MVLPLVTTITKINDAEPFVTLSFLIPDYKAVVMKQMRWMICGVIFFTLVIVSAFYVTVSTLLKQKS
jgi:two-component system phosphate regulon sensor histidine kinase PhoR